MQPGSPASGHDDTGKGSARLPGVDGLPASAESGRISPAALSAPPGVGYTPTGEAQRLGPTVTLAAEPRTARVGASDSARRIYRTADGARLPSVTTILGAFPSWGLVRWMVRTPDHETVSREARRVGTAVHRRIAADLTGLCGECGDAAGRAECAAAGCACGCHGWPEADAECERAWQAWRKWRANYKPHVLEVERAVWSEREGYAGTLDLYARVGRLRTLIDVKTSGSIYPDVRLQLAAYAQAMRERGLGRPSARAVLRLDRDFGEYEWRIFARESDRPDLAAWRAVLALYRWQRQADREGRAAARTADVSEARGMLADPAEAAR